MMKKPLMKLKNIFLILCPGSSAVRAPALYGTARKKDDFKRAGGRGFKSRPGLKNYFSTMLIIKKDLESPLISKVWQHQIQT